MKPEASQLLTLAQHDMVLAEFALEREIHEQCIFHCQQALEKSLKALVIERSPSGRPRRTHDLVSLAEEMSLELSQEDLSLLRRLGEQYATTRYGEDVDYDQTRSLDYLRRTRTLFAWLQQQLS